MTGKSPRAKVVIDKETIHHLAWLSRIKIPEDTINKYIPQLQGILDFFNQLDTIDTTDVPPTFHAIELKDVFREDTPRESLSIEDVFKNTKSRKDKYFRTKGLGGQK